MFRGNSVADEYTFCKNPSLVGCDHVINEFLSDVYPQAITIIGLHNCRLGVDIRPYSSFDDHTSTRNAGTVNNIAAWAIFMMMNQHEKDSHVIAK